LPDSTPSRSGTFTEPERKAALAAPVPVKKKQQGDVGWGTTDEPNGD